MFKKVFFSYSWINADNLARFVSHKLFAAWVKLWIACIYLFLSHSPVTNHWTLLSLQLQASFFLVNVIIWSDVLSKEMGFGWIV